MAHSYSCGNYANSTNSNVAGINTVNNIRIRYHDRDWFARIRRIMEKSTLSMFLALICWAVLPVVIMVESPVVKLVGIFIQGIILSLQIMIVLSEYTWRKEEDD